MLRNISLSSILYGAHAEWWVRSRPDQQSQTVHSRHPSSVEKIKSQTRLSLNAVPDLNFLVDFSGSCVHNLPTQSLPKLRPGRRAGGRCYPPCAPAQAGPAPGRSVREPAQLLNLSDVMESRPARLHTRRRAAQTGFKPGTRS